MEKNIVFELVNNVGTIKINRPEAYNALNQKIVHELDEIIEQVRENDSIKVLIIGSDHNFAAGGDIKAMIDCTPEEAMKFGFSSTFNKIENLPIPTIAAIDGYALGGGLELALTCDMRIATKEAKLGLPETGLGIMPGAGGSIRLPRLVGSSKAKEMIFMGTVLRGEEAEKIGLVNKAVNKDELMETALKWADKLKKKGPLALKMAKETIVAGLTLDLKSGIDLEAKNWADLFNTSDQKEGMNAFIQKRKPEFQGK